MNAKIIQKLMVCLLLSTVCQPSLGTAPKFVFDPHLPHLGDGSTTNHYFPIVDFLRNHSGSEKKASAIAKEQLRIDKHNRDLESQKKIKKGNKANWLKPPSASLVESEFSHLLGAIARDNKLLGAAVFDNHGLKLAESGTQVTPIRIDASLAKRILRANRANGKPLAIHCQAFKKNKLSTLKKCQSQFAVFLPIFDRSQTKAIRVGYSFVLADKHYYSPRAK